jgi:hypothetical protein
MARKKSILTADDVQGDVNSDSGMDEITLRLLCALISNPTYRGATHDDVAAVKMASRLRQLLVDEKLAQPVDA